MEKILVVEDSSGLSAVLKNVLELEGYEVYAACSAEDGLELVGEKDFALILADYKLPKMDGIQFLRSIRDKGQDVPIVIMTAFGSIETAVDAMKHGANDFVCKPFEPEYLCSLVNDMVKHRRIVKRGDDRRGMITFLTETKNPKMQKLLWQAKKGARFDIPVLILGESGVGKELVARYIHENSPRKDEEFVSVNCGAIPPDLLESEFFGHEMGAFTGSTQSRAGLFEIAKNGTIFLDEIGEMEPALQVKLLRALQEGEIRRIGSNSPIKANPRIIAATNKDLEKEIAVGRFREDFYYRLAVLTLDVPPLRERKEDLEPLIQRFLEYYAKKIGKDVPKLHPEAEELILSYPWPGNIRELENVIERAVILCGGEIFVEHLGIDLDIDFSLLDEVVMTLPEVAQKAARKAEINMITAALKKTGGNKAKASEVLGVSYKTLLNKVKEYNLAC